MQRRRVFAKLCTIPGSLLHVSPLKREDFAPGLAVSCSALAGEEC